MVLRSIAAELGQLPQTASLLPLQQASDLGTPRRHLAAIRYITEALPQPGRSTYRCSSRRSVIRGRPPYRRWLHCRYPNWTVSKHIIRDRTCDGGVRDAVGDTAHDARGCRPKGSGTSRRNFSIFGLTGHPLVAPSAWANALCYLRYCPSKVGQPSRAEEMRQCTTQVSTS